MKFPLKLMFVLTALLLVSAAHAQERQGTVVDASNSKPIAGAIITVGKQTVVTDAEGHYRISGDATPLQVRAPGYRREAMTAASTVPDTIQLAPLVPKALYLTVYGIGAPFLRDPALDVIQKSGLNALVIDLKGDRGLIPYPSAL
ncbi:MAG: carboxypeptidase regulatory-like domain-containing protein, partial [Reyranellales bacterium]